MGCFLELFILPFRMLYWFAKVIWEIIELFSHRGHRHPRRRVRVSSPRFTSSKPHSKRATDQTARSRPLKASASFEIPDRMAKTIEKSVKVARNDRRELQTRLEAYRKAFREIDDMRKSAPADGMHLVQFLEDTLVKEYRALIDAHTSIKGMVTLSPGLPIETAADARRDGMQGAEWSAVLDEHTCPLCRELDGKVISVTHPDFDRFKPPLHDGCRCIRVYILNEEENVEYTWVTPSEELLHK